MTNQSDTARDRLQDQLKDLDQIFQDTIETLNIASGTERVMKWRAKTVAVITESLGQKEGQKFAALQPGPSFTNDLVEEFTDLIEYFRIPLANLMKQSSQAAARPSGGTGGKWLVSPPDLPLPHKRLGQNFLIDPNIVRKIVALAELGSGDHVLEIGPGRGILTEALCHVAGRVTAVEVDLRLHAHLKSRQAELPHVELVWEGALAYPVENLPVGTVVVANLPYYISTPLLFRLLDQRHRFPRMVLMLQNEVADRLVSNTDE